MKQQDKQVLNQEKQERQLLDAVIAEQVLHSLGQPGNLHRVQVKHLWETHYRVNILVGPDVTTSRVAHSFFLAADGEGNIIDSSPRITKLY